MVRLMLVLAPVMCILGGIAVSSLLGTYMRDLDSNSSSTSTSATSGTHSHKGGDKKGRGKADASYVMKNEVI